MKLLAVDPGFASLGWAVLEVIGDRVEVVDHGLIETKKEAKKRRLHGGSDDARRIDDLAHALRAVALAHYARLGAYELPAAAKGARAGHAMGIAHAVVRLVLTGHCAAVVEVTVDDARRAAARTTSRASEKDAHAAIVGRFWPGDECSCEASAHELDAIAIGLAALETQVIKAARAA